MRTASFATALLVVAAAAVVRAQSVRGVVVDQTGLPLPGAVVRVLDGAADVATVTTGTDGTFMLDDSWPGDALAVSLDGFETVRVERDAAIRITASDGVARITLPLARATDTTTVVAPATVSSSPTAPLLGGSLTADTVARLPSNRLKPRESLPLLPSVIRGADGLLQVGGARAHDTPLVIDGFNVTDPATGLSSISLPNEAVAGVDVLRDPTSVTYGGMLGGLTKLETRAGDDHRFKMGLQSLLPRPRFTAPGIGRVEGFSPRIYAQGSTPGGGLRFLTALEYSYERIAVPEVSDLGGPDVVEENATFFGRVDTTAGRHALTIELIAFPSAIQRLGLGPRRDESAAADQSDHDLFTGVSYRRATDNAGILTVRLDAISHDATLAPRGTGPSVLSPDGWRGTWFAAVSRSARRVGISASWERLLRLAERAHDISVTAEGGARRLRGTVTETPIVVENEAGEVVRRVHFGPSASIAASDDIYGAAARDVWHAHTRLQIDAGLRLDSSTAGGTRPSGRAGIRFSLDASGKTVLKAGYGSFVGNLPLAVEAFDDYPTRVDTRIDSGAGQSTMATLRPRTGSLRLPRATAATVSIERELSAGLDAQISMTDRRSTELATLVVPYGSGDLLAESVGASSYREVQASIRRTWRGDQQLFVSYVRSSSRGDLNDFATLFQQLDTPLLQPGGSSLLPSDAPHRLIAWGTFDLPSRSVISPAFEWRSGFPYSALNEQYLYEGVANGRRFPAFFSADVVLFKTFTVRARSADFGIQLFNVTGHRNPRDAYPVVGTSRFGQFANSTGRILRGYMNLKWK